MTIRRPAPPILPLPAKPAIAVLPFDDLGEPGSRYLADGIAEDVIVELSRFEGIMVIARQSSFLFRDRGGDLQAVGRALGIHYVLQGSLRRSGDRIRITTQLSDAGNGTNVWADRYDGSVDDLLAFEDDAVQRIVATLAGRVEADQAQRLARRPPETFQAYECLLQGKAYHHRHSAEANERALQCLERAVELDPEFALAHAWLACAIAQRNVFHPDPQLLERAYRHALRARELEDGQSECHRILAAYHIVRGRLHEARHHQERALALNPNDDRIVCQMGELLTLLGRPDEAVGWIEKAMRLNPFHPDSYFAHYGRALEAAGRVAEARAAFRRVAAARAC